MNETSFLDEASVRAATAPSSRSFASSLKIESDAILGLGQPTAASSSTLETHSSPQLLRHSSQLHNDNKTNKTSGASSTRSHRTSSRPSLKHAQERIESVRVQNSNNPEVLALTEGCLEAVQYMDRSK